MSTQIITEKNAAFADFDAYVEKTLQDWGVPGAAIGVIRGQEVILAKGYGYRDVENRLPVDVQTLFAIGSTTKAFTAMAIAMLVDQGKLEWDKPVREVMPDFRLYDLFASERMTPRDLLCHRSGLPRHDFLWYGTSYTRKELYERLRYLEPNVDLRTQFQYQNLMFLAAGVLLEYISGQTWEEFVRKEIFEKLEMDSSNFSVEVSKASENKALPYNKASKSIKQVPFRDLDAIGPAGSINSNILDMAKWLITQMNGGSCQGKQLVSKENFEQMHTPIIGVPDSFFPGTEQVEQLGKMDYGLGWALQAYRGNQMIYHSGNIDGFSALVSFMPEESVGTIIFTNMKNTLSIYPLMLNIYDRLMNDDPLPLNDKFLEISKKMDDEIEKTIEEAHAYHRKHKTQPSHPLEEYTGDFFHPGYGSLKIELADEELHAKYNTLTFKLLHYKYDIFEAVNVRDEDIPMKVSFHTDKEGNITGIAVPFEPMVSDILFSRIAAGKMR